MRASSARARVVVGGAALGVLAAIAACADTSDAITIGGGELDGGGSLAPRPDAANDADSGALQVLACTTSECPAPWGSCPTDGVLGPYKCSTDLANDPDNCGTCGTQCRNVAPVGVFMQCIQGTCRASCVAGALDCNGIVDDGCEVSLFEDPKNCGACGKACPAGVPCLGGTCGCAGKLTLCNGQCVDLTTDDANCGTCGFDCNDHQPDGGAPHPHMKYGCSAGACTDLECAKSDGFWANCNGSLADGCEVNLYATDDEGYLDSKNCGGCGITCAPGKKCFDANAGGVKCQCPEGLTICPFNACADLDSDPSNCGSCGYLCDPPPSTAIGMRSTCERARCGLACDKGRSDCNARIDDGCEADLLHDPRNCGTCGNACDVAAGQPCVNGVCVTKPCDGTVPK